MMKYLFTILLLVGFNTPQQYCADPNTASKFGGFDQCVVSVTNSARQRSLSNLANQPQVKWPVRKQMKRTDSSCMERCSGHGSNWDFCQSKCSY